MSLWLRRRDLRTHLYIATVIKFLATYVYIFLIFFLIFLLDVIIVTINLIQLLAAIVIRINYLSIYLSIYLCGRLTRPGGYSGISSDGDDRMEPKVKTQKNPQGFQQNPKKSLNQKLTPKKPHADFVALKSSRKG